MNTDYIHHGTMFSYYSAKTRAYLSCKRLPYVERYDGPDISRRIAEITHKVMIPVVETPDGQILQDTTEIIDALEARHPERPLLPPDPVMLLVTRIVEFFIDELWVSTAMNSRWNDPDSKRFAIREFGRRIGGSFGMEGEAALAIGQRVADQMQSYLPRLGVGDAAGQQAARTFFETASRLLDKAVGPDRYALGPRPTLLDVCLFTGYYAHQYRDHGAAHAFLKSETPDLCYFLDNMHAGQGAPVSGDTVLSDELLDYLRYVGPAAAAFAAGTEQGARAAAVDTGIGAAFNPGIGPFPIPLGEAAFERGSSGFSAWKAQRVREVYGSLNPADRSRADELLELIGWRDLLDRESGFELAREDYQIVLRSCG